MLLLRLAPLLLSLLATVIVAPAAEPDLALGGPDGVLRLSHSGQPWCTLRPGAFDKAWGFAGPAVTGQPGGPAHFTITAGGGALAGEAEVASSGPQRLAAHWRFTATRPAALNSLHVSAEFTASDLAGGTWVADDHHGTFPATLGEQQLFGGAVRHVAITTRDGRTLGFAFAAPIRVGLQDDRKWSQTFSLRLGVDADLAAGEARALDLTLETPAETVLDGPVTMTAGPAWIPFHDELDIVPGSALDLSAQGFQDAPAGKHGRVIATPAGHFAFADSPQRAQRFYGVNLCFGAQYLPHDDADRLVERLVRLGYNAVRIHHYEGELLGWKAGGAPLAEKLDQLDYLVAACVKRGLYLTTDLFVSRPVAAAQLGLAADRPVNYKVLVPVVPAAFADWQGFARTLLDHRNPYTGRRWADEPALAWLAMINEGNFENYYGDMQAIPEWRTAFAAWARARYADRAALAAAWGAELRADEDPAAPAGLALPADAGADTPRSRDLQRFLAATERDMFRRMRAFLRDELKCAALLTNCSSWYNRVLAQGTRTDFDFVDDHFYIDHPEFLAAGWQPPSRSLGADPVRSGRTGGRANAFVRLDGKPMTVTEFNYVAPSPNRGLGGMLAGALGALQDWDGMWRFAYSHDAASLTAPAPLSYFNLDCDPLNQAAERMALCLFLRGDLAPAPHGIAIAMGAGELAEPRSVPFTDRPWDWAAWVTRISTRVVPAAPGEAHRDGGRLVLPLGIGRTDAPAAGPTALTIGDDALLGLLRGQQLLPAANATAPAQGVLAAETGQVLIDGAHGTMLVDAPRSAGGFIVPGATLDAVGAGVRLSAASAPATVLISSLDGQPLRASKRLLVTHLTDLQDSGTRFGERARQTLLAFGHLPHLVAAGSVTIRLARTAPGEPTVWALSAGGRRLERVPATSDGDGVTVTLDVAGKDGARMLYEVSTP